MLRRTGMVCAAALLIAAAGCEGSSFLLSWVGSGGKRQVVAGSINEVATHLQASLGKIDIVVAVNPLDNDTIKLNGQTKSGKRFALVLKRQVTNQVEHTAIAVEWEKDDDPEFWGIVLDLLVNPAPIVSGTPTAAAGIPSGR